MNESLKAQYEYFIDQCLSLEALEVQEKRIIRNYYHIPEELKEKIADKKVKLLNIGDQKK